MKIPKPILRGSTYRITVTYQGQRYSATRDTSKECEQWAALKLLELKAGTVQEQKGVKAHYPFKLLFEKYYDEVGKHKNGTYVLQQKKAFDKYFGDMGNTSIHDITPQMLTDWRNQRLKKVKPGTVLRQISLYSAVFTYAEKELFLIKENPFFSISKPEQPNSRHRLVPAHEIEKVKAAFKYNRDNKPILAMHYVAWCFLFAIETAMRRGEILGIKKEHVFDDYIHLPKTKNGTSRNVPLTREAKHLISLIQHDGEQLIPITLNSFKLAWKRHFPKTGIDGLTFHDTRHEAITRLVNIQKLPVEILAKITGHKKIDVLVNTYYNPSASDLAKILNGS